MKNPLFSSARGASFHTKHASKANVIRVVLLDANSYLALRLVTWVVLHISVTSVINLYVYFEVS
jgi:hypothetical protein